jgi:hypothetical protein
MSALQDKPEVLVHFFVKELEDTWRVKFPDCTQFVNKKGVDQIVMIVDLKGAKLKDLTNQKMMKLYQQLCLEVQRFFPQMVHKIYVLNTPMFFENIWESQLVKCINDNTLKKIVISSNSTHSDLQDQIDEYELPSIYGGTCECKATCVYSEKGPWTEVENLINYKDPQPQSDEDVSEGEIDANIKMNLLGSKGALPGKMNKGFGNEEFKMVEGEDDNIDLLNEKVKSKNLEEFYEQDQILDLKNHIMMNMPESQSRMGHPSMS